MAYTKIIKVKSNLNLCLDYTSNPKKTERRNAEDLNRLLNYTQNSDKTEHQLYVSGFNCIPQNAYEIMMETKIRWRKPVKDGNILAYHIIQSFSPGEATPDQVHQIGCEFAQRFLADRFECTVSTHLDRGHLHNHIVVNSVSYKDGKMFRSDFDAYYKGIRKISDELCRENRLSVIETDGKGKSYAEWISGQTGKPTIRGMVRKDVEQAIVAADSFDGFILELQNMGYTVKYGPRVEHMAVRHKNAQRNVRIDWLDPRFSESALREYYRQLHRMSRLGRNYLQVGMYTEMLFPQKGVRFIAINDGVDSAMGDNDFTPLRNLFNEWMVRDTSKKIKAVKKAKGLSGKPVTSKPVYGYLMDDDENFIIDEEAASVVKQIYQLCLAGNGPTKIARMLTEQQIPTPGTLEYQRTGSTRRYHPGYECKWATNTVVHLLENREYTGCLVNFKTEKPSYKMKHSVDNPIEKQAIFENHHEPIIDLQTWERVQELRKQRKRPNRYDDVGLFSGLLFCADCGHVMYQQRYQTDKRKQDCYICGSYKKRTADCTAHFIRTDLLTAGVLDNLRKVTAYAQKHEARFVKLLIQQNEMGGKRKQAAATKQLEQVQRRIAELSRYIKRLYEDNVNGKISDERFMEMSADYEAEQRELKEKAAALQGELDKAQEATVNAEKFMNVVRKYLSIEELTHTLLREMVEKIVVYECEYDENEVRRQRIDIYYSFVDKIDLPEE